MRIDMGLAGNGRGANRSCLDCERWRRKPVVKKTQTFEGERWLSSMVRLNH